MTDKIEQRFQKKGLKLTDQRRIIAKVILESKEAYGESDHPDVDELYNRVSKIDTKISIATVYRTVKLFEEAGILTKHDFKTGKARYELNDDHNHLIDIKSGEIIEFVDEEIDKLYKKEFIAEAHKRIYTPFFIVIMVLIGAMASILGKFDRKTSAKRLFYPISAALTMQIYLIISPQIIIQYHNTALLIYISILFLYLIILFFISNSINIFKKTIFYKNRIN